MNTEQACPACRRPLPANAPQGLCPECLMKGGLASGMEIGTGTTASGGGGSGDERFVPPTVEEIARYFPQLEVLAFIGQGGMGAVYKARQKQLDRVVALKILPPGIGDDAAFAERFAREAKAMAKLNHPGIVTIHDFGQTDGLFYFLMEYVDGATLWQLLDTGRVSPREALAVVPQICDALQYAHDAGIVHRDIKPENILLDRQGRVKVADFGLAKLVGTGADPAAEGEAAAAAPAQTEAGRVMGTPQYMAPEQRERPREVDHRADIYSLGVVFYQLLTGELPSRPVEPPSKRVQIDVRLDEVVLKALEKEPQRRYQQAGEIKTRVETIATTPPEHRPPAIDDRMIEESRRQVRWPANGLLVVGMLNCLAVLMMALVWGWRGEPGAEPYVAPSGAEIVLGVATILAVLLVSLTPGVVPIVAALKMKRLEAYGLALAASFLTIIATPACLIGLPVGIWALVVLSQRDVRAAFRHKRHRKRSGAPVAASGTKKSIAVTAALIGSAFLLLGLLVCLVFVVLVMERVDYDFGGLPSIERLESRTEARVDVAEHPVGPWKDRLPSGVTVALLGVAENPSKDRPWWQPDGSPLAERPYDWLGASVDVNKDEMAREFAVRLSNTPSEPVGVQWKIDPSLGFASRDPPGLAESAPDTHGVAVRMRAGQQTADVHIGVAAGAWQTAAESQARGGDVIEGKGSVVFSPAEEKEGSITMTVAHDMIDAQGQGPQVRVIAVGLDGREHHSEPSGNGRAGKLSQLTVTFSKLSLKDVKTFRLLTRPYQWAEFRNVSLRAGQETGERANTGPDAAGSAHKNYPLAEPNHDFLARYSIRNLLLARTGAIAQQFVAGFF